MIPILTSILNYRKRKAAQQQFLSSVSPENRSTIADVDVGDAPTGFGEYDQLFANNPYRNLTYNKSAWQDFLSAMGFRTGYDDYVEQARVNSQEYDAGIFSLIQQNQFNSPAEQAERMRAAGLNPDLQGLGDVASAASPMDDPNGMQPSGADDASQAMNIVTQVGSAVVGLIPGVLSFASQLQQYKGIRLENDAKELSFGSNAADAAAKFFLEGVTEDEYRQAFEKNDWSNILEAAKKDSKYLSDTFLSSSKGRKRFSLAYNLHSNSLLSEIQKYKTFDEFEKNRKSLLSQRASKFFSEDDATMEDLMKAFLNPFESYQQRTNEILAKMAELRSPELEQGLANAEMQNQLEYEQAIDPSLQAGAENAVNRAVQQQNEIIEATNQLFSDIMSNLKQSDNWWSKIAMALVGIARAQLLSGMQMSFGRRQQVNSQTGDIENLSSFQVSQ